MLVIAISTDEDVKPQYVKMQVVTDLKEKIIAKFAKNSIAEGATVKTDAYHSYRKPLAERHLAQKD